MTDNRTTELREKHEHSSNMNYCRNCGAENEG
jgi:hypothetical protein